MITMMLVGVAAPSLAKDVGFDHDDWTAVLQRFVDRQGFVDYDGLAQERTQLDRYLSELREVSPTTQPQRFPTPDDELAYYINAYNALAIEGVLSRGPDVESVWSGGIISGYSFFVAMKVTLGGERTNLRKLENKVIRAKYRDPRIHAALNCASIGCPRLPQEAFVGQRLQAQLDAAMREFVMDLRHVRIDAATQTVYLSKIFDWFKDDFVKYEKAQGSDAGVVGYINRFRDDGTQLPDQYTIKILDYDKRLNRQGREADG